MDFRISSENSRTKMRGGEVIQVLGISCEEFSRETLRSDPHKDSSLIFLVDHTRLIHAPQYVSDSIRHGTGT